MAYDMYGNWIPTPYDFYGRSTGFGGAFPPPVPGGAMHGGAQAFYGPPIGPYDAYGFGPYVPPYTVPVNDDDIRMDVEDNIAADWVISRRDFENIYVEVEDGIVTLSGQVSDKRTKHHAYSVAFWTPGVVDVINNLEVVEEKERERGKEKAKSKASRRGEYSVAARSSRGR